MEHWDKISAVGRMQDYIEKHINEPITLYNLSKEANYSPWHSSKIFKELLGKSPFEYIRVLRLSKAAVKLRDPGIKIIDVAFEFVFDSHEGFTRAFSKQFGITPKKYSKKRTRVDLFMPHRILDHYLKIQKGEEIDMTNKPNLRTVFVQVIERPIRKMIFKRGCKATHYFEYCEEVGCDVWEVLTNIREAIYEPIGMWLPENMITHGTSKYVQGVEVPFDFKGILPEGFEIVEMGPCMMMIFQGQPYDDEKFQEAIEDIWEVMKTYDPKIYGFEWAEELAPRFQLEPIGYRGYIEGRPVRRINI